MDEIPNLLESIKTVRHFRKLNLSELTTIISSGRVRRFRIGETVFTEADPCTGMFVLIRGMVHLCKSGPLGQVNIMAIIEPIIMFNEITVLDGGPNPTTAIAVQNCLVWQIGYEAFQRLLEKIPQVGLSLLQVLATRNRQLITHYEDLSFRSVVARTSKLLLDLSDYGHHSIDRRHCSIEEMASRIATVPEAISRSLYILKNRDAIRVSRIEIAVLSVEKLANSAQLGLGLSE